MTLSLLDRPSGSRRLRRLLGGGLAFALGAGMAAAVTAPAPASAAEPGTVYEAENQTFTANSVQTEHAGYTGTGFVGGFGSTGSSLTTAVTTASAGTHDLFVRYANGGSDKTLTLEVNGAARQVTLRGSGAWNSYGFMWASVDLQAGANSIVLRRSAADSGSVNVDNLRVAPRAGTRYEAESAALSGGASTASDHAGYTGTGFVGGIQTVGQSAVTFTVTADEAGVHPASLRYAAGPNPFNGAKRVTLDVNGTTSSIVLPGFGSWKHWGDYALDLPLDAGPNTVAIRYLAGDDGNVNLDHLDVKEPEAPTCTGEVEADDDFSGTELDRCRWTSVFNEEPSGYRLADGALRIDARPGDLSGGTTSAKNVVLQQAPAAPWMAQTDVSLDGTDHYLQGGLVVMGDAANFAKVMVIRTPTDGWKVELGQVANNSLRFTSSPTLPEGAQNDVDLRLWIADGMLRGSYSLDDGASWSLVGAGYPATGLGSPRVGLGAFNGTGAETASFDAFAVGAPVRVPSTTTIQLPGPRTVGQDATVEVTVSAPGATPGGEVTLRDGDAVVGTATLTDGKATFDVGPFTRAGTRTLRATYAGDSGAAPSEATGTLEVVKAAPQITVTPSPATVRTGQTSTVTVTVAAGDRTPTGLVTLSDGDGPLGSGPLVDGVATFEVGPYAEAGVRTLTAGYGGDDAVAGGTASADLTVADEPVASTTTVRVEPGTIEVGSPATVWISVSAAGPTPTGTVTLRDGEQVVGTAELTGGEATLQAGPWATAGDRTLTAEYAGSPTVAPSSAVRTVTVVKALPRVTISATPDPVRADQAATVTVTVTSGAVVPTGAVVLRANDVTVGTADLVDGVATFTVDPFGTEGPRMLTADYAGNAALAPGGATTVLSVVPARVASTVTVDAAPASVPIGETAVVTVTVTAPGTTPTGEVSLRDAGGDPLDAPLVDGVASFVVGPHDTPGDRTLTATYAGSSTVAAGGGTGTLTVRKLAPVVSVSATPASIAVGQTASVSVSVTAPGATPGGSYTLTDGEDGDVNVAGSLDGGAATVTVGPFETAGPRTLTLLYSGSSTVEAGSATTSLTVVPATSTVTVTPAPGGVEIGSTTEVEVEVDAAVTPTGRVVVTDGSAKRWVGTLEDGVAVVRVGPWAAAGRRTLTASYAGDADVAAGSGTASIVVRARPTPVVTVAPKTVDAAADRRTGTVRMTCAPAGVQCAGSVELRSGGAAIGSARFTIAGGRTVSVRVNLNAKARTLLARKARVPATLATTMAGKRTSVAVTLTR